MPTAAPRCWHPRLLPSCGSAVLMGLRWLPELLPSQTEGRAQPGSWTQSSCLYQSTRLPCVAPPACQGGWKHCFCLGCVCPATSCVTLEEGRRTGRTAGTPSRERLAGPDPMDVPMRQCPCLKCGHLSAGCSWESVRSSTARAPHAVRDLSSEASLLPALPLSSPMWHPQFGTSGTAFEPALSRGRQRWLCASPPLPLVCRGFGSRGASGGLRR